MTGSTSRELGISPRIWAQRLEYSAPSILTERDPCDKRPQTFFRSFDFLTVPLQFLRKSRRLRTFPDQTLRCERLLKIGQRRRVPAHRLVIFHAAPLSVHRDLCSIETAMQAGRNETRRVAHGTLGRTNQQIKKSLLIRRFDRKYIDQCDKLSIGRDRRHAQIRRLLRGQPPKPGDVPRRKVGGRCAKAPGDIVCDGGDFGVGIRGPEGWHKQHALQRAPISA
jgi:hypothetical protein